MIRLLLLLIFATTLLASPIPSPSSYIVDKNRAIINKDESDNLLSDGERMGRTEALGQVSQAKLIVSDRLGRNRVELVPGLLHGTLLNKGSFSFGAKLVRFDRLKVLGNVYTNTVNGRPLRETYLLKNLPTNSFAHVQHTPASYSNVTQNKQLKLATKTQPFHGSEY